MIDFLYLGTANERGSIHNVYENKEIHTRSQSPNDATEDVTLCAYHYVVPLGDGH